jgi:phosphate transport system substrate-binding protein
VYNKDGAPYILFDYLAKTSPDWKRDADAAGSIGYPYGSDGEGNERVSVLVEATEGAIGTSHIPIICQAAKSRLCGCQNPTMANSFRQVLRQSNQPSPMPAGIWYECVRILYAADRFAGQTELAICGATYVIMSRSQLSQDVAPNVLRFFDWAYRDG